MAVRDRQRAFVTGGGGQIGLAIVDGLVGNGMDVTLQYRTYNDSIRALQRRGVEVLQHDFRDGVLHPVEADILVHCAASNDAGTSVLDTDLLNWNEVIASSLTSALLATQASLPTMLNNSWGRIVFIGSYYSKHGAAYNGAYAAAKHGLTGLMRSLALEVAASGVTVNELLLGAVHGSLLTRTAERRSRVLGLSAEQYLDRAETSTPRRVLSTPSEIVGGVLFLLSDEAAAITGASLPIDGGISAQ